MGILAVTLWQGIVTFLFVVTCILLILIILLQKGRGGGLSSAFGGAGGYSAFGAKTGDVFTWITVGLTGMFIIMSVLGNWAFVPAPAAASPPAKVAPVGGAPAGGTNQPAKPAQK